MSFSKHFCTDEKCSRRDYMLLLLLLQLLSLWWLFCGRKGAWIHLTRRSLNDWCFSGFMCKYPAICSFLQIHLQIHSLSSTYNNWHNLIPTNHPALKTLNCRGARTLSHSRVQNIKHTIPTHLLAIIIKCLPSSNTRLTQAFNFQSNLHRCSFSLHLGSPSHANGLFWLAPVLPPPDPQAKRSRELTDVSIQSVIPAGSWRL